MKEYPAEQVRESVDAVYRQESRRILATLIRLLGDFDLAEDALHDAFRAALEQWQTEGVPANHRAWSGNREVGEGRMTITESRPNDLIRMHMEFVKPFKASNTTEFTFRPEGNHTVVA